MTGARRGWYTRWGKRSVDLALGTVLIVVALPLLLIAALLVRATSRGPVFFLQDRLGRDGRIFRILKFRTMTDVPRTQHVDLFGAASGVTPVGYWLRRTKLDELPQLVNVLLGDMSLVGPRPALPSQRSEYDDETARRLALRPGMTGLAQVNGAIHLTWPERWQWDVLYVDTVSLALDVRLLARTALVVVLGEGRFTAHAPSRGGGRA